MTLIEGVGDEVINFFGVVLLIGLGLIAWWSTRISELPPIRTVLIFERRTQTETRSAAPVPGNSSTGGQSTSETTNSSPLSDGNRQSGVVDEEEVAVADLKCDRNVRKKEENSNSVEPEKEAEEGSESSTVTRDQVPTEVGDRESGGENGDSIRIRLKYLNDDQKLVQGQLHELLGDFKRRHFSLELSREKRVRLIFNGQVLQSDDQTLQGCGLYDNCVVHCLVHTQFNVNRPSTQSTTHINPTPPEWNLGGLLYLSLSLLLGFAWFFRFHYAQLFTLTTTTALTGLTAMFAVSIIGMYLPNQEAPPA